MRIFVLTTTYELRVEKATYVTTSVVDPDPELFAGSGSGVGSGINHFGSGSGQSGSGMNFIPNFSVKKSHFLNQIAQKMGIFSTYIYVHIKYVYIYV
jgi:hypothetical protein